jgi:cell division protein FtsL
MRLSIRLAAMVVMLVGVAMTLTWMRTDTIQAGNRLHVLYGEKHNLEKACSRLELQIAALKSQERMRQQAIELLKADEAEGGQPVMLPRKGATSRDPAVVVDGGLHALPKSR